MAFEKSAQRWSLTWDHDWVTAVTFVGKSRRIAAGNNLGDILVWELPEKPDAPAPLPILRLKGHSNAVTRLRSTADGRIISSSLDHTIRIWTLPAMMPKSTETVTLNSRAINEAKRRSGAKTPTPVDAVIAGVTDSIVFTGHKEWVTTFDLSQEETDVLSGDDKGQVVHWSIADRKEIRRWQVKGWASTVSISPDRRRAVVGERFPLVFDSGRHAGLKLWDIEKKEVIKDLSAEYKGQFFVASAYSADGKWIAVGRGGEIDGTNGKVTILSAENGKKVREMSPGHLNGLTDLAFHPDGKHILTTGRDTLIRIWSVAEGTMVKELGKGRGGQFKDWYCALCVSRDGKWVAGADMAGLVTLWTLD